MMIKRRGFTLIELLVVLTILATLLSLVAPRYSGSVGHAKEAVLKENLATVRDAIDKYHADTGAYPNSLETLVTRKYLRKLPVDPITESATTWVFISPADQGQDKIADIHSGAPGTASDGSSFQDW